eukprot:gnl/Spiro4/26818_TR13328_c0_g1_i1.p1 gnl/Spiro4/26818_TR13328_c0_g1~~gnl/Spiro4/26818_TR13328_c0_g1_i1.p1  ORF type:complete len:490 (+),score=105.97 gnl/Spiro4/26818_TR13328_c0_g1_i1:101-1570(+)
MDSRNNSPQPFFLLLVVFLVVVSSHMSFTRGALRRRALEEEEEVVCSEQMDGMSSALEACENCVSYLNCEFDPGAHKCRERNALPHSLWVTKMPEHCKCPTLCLPGVLDNTCHPKEQQTKTTTTTTTTMQDDVELVAEEDESETEDESLARFCAEECSVADDGSAQFCFGGLSWGRLARLAPQSVRVGSARLQDAMDAYPHMRQDFATFSIARIPLERDQYDSSGVDRVWAAVSNEGSHYRLHVGTSSDPNDLFVNPCASWRQSEVEDGSKSGGYSEVKSRWISTDPFMIFYGKVEDSAGPDCWRVKNLLSVHIALAKMFAQHNRAVLTLDDISRLPCGGHLRNSGRAKFHNDLLPPEAWVPTAVLYPLRDKQLFWQKQIVKLQYTPKLGASAEYHLEQLETFRSHWKSEDCQDALRSALKDFNTQLPKGVEVARAAESAHSLASVLLAMMVDKETTRSQCRLVGRLVLWLIGSSVGVVKPDLELTVEL